MWSSAPLRDEEAVLQHLNELISQLAGRAAGGLLAGAEKRLATGPGPSTSPPSPAGKLTGGGKAGAESTAVLGSC